MHYFFKLIFLPLTDHFLSVYFSDAPITNWWHDGRYRFAFCRSQRGFILINNNPGYIENQKFKVTFTRYVYMNKRAFLSLKNALLLMTFQNQQKVII